MPLTDFVRYLNAQLPFTHSPLQAGSPFFTENGRVVVCHADMRLESEFFPIIATENGGIRGHVADLYVTGKSNFRRVEAQAVFVLPENREELVFVDRLVRTLHTLNYLTYLDRKSRGLLLLKVHPRHVASVASDHGLAFEEILRSCGLLPKEITLELEIREGCDSAHLLRAIANYKSRGYGIALTGSDKYLPDLTLIREAQPMIVSLDRNAIHSTESVRPFIDELHRLKIKAMLRNESSPPARKSLLDSGFDLHTLPSGNQLLQAS
jgi:EAL domain-containing protein (putative c-di-GMP-specific phosphodiesterase class I)